MDYKEDLERLHLKLQALAEQISQQKNPQPARHWYTHPLLLTLLGVLGAGLVALLVARWEVNQARESQALDDHIGTVVGLKLQPVNDTLSKLDDDIGKAQEDIAYLKAKVEDATTKKIVGFSRLPVDKIAAQLPEITTTLAEANRKNLVVPPQAVIELRTKLAQVRSRDPQFWAAVSNVVNFQTLIAEKSGEFPNAEKVKNTPCKFVHVAKGASASRDTFRMSGCSQQLDNIFFSNGTFENMVIIYKGGPLRLENVVFKNCVFAVSFPASPKPAARKLVEALLSGSGQLSNFTLSTG